MGGERESRLKKRMAQFPPRRRSIRREQKREEIEKETEKERERKRLTIVIESLVSLFSFSYCTVPTPPIFD